MSLFQPARNTVLLLLGIAALCGPAFAFFNGQFSGPGFSLRFAAMLVAAALIALSQFRDWVLAVAGALAPLPGLSVFWDGSSQAIPAPPDSCLPALVYVLGFFVALIAGDRFAQHVADDEDPKAAAILALRENVRLFAPVLVLAIVVPGMMMVLGPLSLAAPALLLATGNGLAVLSAWLAVPLAGSLVSGSEDFIARANRRREGWARRLERVAKVTQSPWSFSASGIFVVLATLAVFGSARLSLGRDVASGLSSDGAAAFVVVAVAAGVALRDWRRTFAVCAVTVASLLFGAWGYVRTGAALDASLLLLTCGLLGIAFVPIAATAATALLSGRQDAQSASEAGIVTAGPIVAAGALAVLALLAPWYREIGEARAGFVLAILFAGLGALVFEPALTGALEEMLPRRQTLAERYRVK